MLMEEVTPEMINEWKYIWNEYKDNLTVNRMSGEDVLRYLREKYLLIEVNDDKAKDVVVRNVLNNKVYVDKLPKGKSPVVAAFIVKNSDVGSYLYENQDIEFNGGEIFVGIDLESGVFFVEGSSLLWDELCAFQGLDESDIQNYFSVAMYILALKRLEII